MAALRAYAREQAASSPSRAPVGLGDGTGFALWAKGVGLDGHEAVGDAFRVSGRTARGWASGLRPRWTLPAMAGVEAWRQGPMGASSPCFPDLGPAWFAAWAAGRGLATYGAQGRPFGYARFGVCRWMATGIPEWLPLACLGVDSDPGRFLDGPRALRDSVARAPMGKH